MIAFMNDVMNRVIVEFIIQFICCLLGSKAVQEGFLNSSGGAGASGNDSWIYAP